MLKPYVDHFKNDEQIITYQVQPKETGLTIYQLLRNQLLISRSLLRKIRKSYRVRFNGQYVDFSTQVKEGDLLEFNFNFDEEADFEPEPMQLDIVYEDANLLVVNKPTGMLVHPTATERTNTLANGVLYYLKAQGNHNLFRPIHRLDRNTSGLVLIAKNQYAHNYMSNQLKRNKIHRQYLALVHGVITDDSGTIDAPIGRVKGSIIQRKVDPVQGKKAITHYRVLKRFSNATLIALSLETGRTHQIRVHLSYLGYPLMGDTLYGGSDELIKRHALHSWKIFCRIPLSHEKKEFEAPLAPDLQDLLNSLIQK
ncbi:hypothetical protein BBF96_01170 [Anoxybacter fermentans]|uniref:Pseudouridine synthase n=1 Tax=Anoxybacter fermentans TaxID=1323375 RepID=A0A3Q9HNW7_9FIRM|nr:RluA family pseudouridine synthase [Anoxybacter fermentans]AZR72123.1 hypothetical protein BBF96_01170 [Anoxybacter fermentans]